MALLNRFSKLNDRGETGVFTFIVTKSVTRDFHRDATTKDFCFGYHRWAISFQRPAEKELGVHLLLRNPSPNTACVVDFTLTLLNREHFSQNEVYSKRQAKFTITNPMQGVSRWIQMSELTERRFSNETGEFLFELSLSNMRTIFECDIQLNPNILTQYKSMLKSQQQQQTAAAAMSANSSPPISGNGAAGSRKNSDQLINLETNCFTFGSFDWSLTIVPLVVASAPSQRGPSQPEPANSSASSSSSSNLLTPNKHQSSSSHSISSTNSSSINGGLASANKKQHQQHQQHHQQHVHQQPLEPVCRVYLNRLNGFDSLCRVKYRVILGHHQAGGSHPAEFVDSRTLDQISDSGGRIKGYQFRQTNILKLIALRSTSQPANCAPATPTPLSQLSGHHRHAHAGHQTTTTTTTTATTLDLRVHIEMFCANTVSEAKVPLQRKPNEPQVSNCSDRNKQAWCVESDSENETVRLKLFFMDLQSVPRNHIRYISWIAYLVKRADSKSGGQRESVAVRNSPHSNYYLQDGIDMGAIMDTDIQVKEMNASPQAYLDGNSLTVHIEWIDSLLLFSHLYNNYDSLATVQRHQLSRELSALQSEYETLEAKYEQLCKLMNSAGQQHRDQQQQQQQQQSPTTGRHAKGRTGSLQLAPSGPEPKQFQAQAGKVAATAGAGNPSASPMSLEERLRFSSSTPPSSAANPMRQSGALAAANPHLQLSRQQTPPGRLALSADEQESSGQRNSASLLANVQMANVLRRRQLPQQPIMAAVKSSLDQLTGASMAGAGLPAMIDSQATYQGPRNFHDCGNGAGLSPRVGSISGGGAAHSDQVSAGDPSMLERRLATMNMLVVDQQQQQQQQQQLINQADAETQLARCAPNSQRLAMVPLERLPHQSSSSPVGRPQLVHRRRLDYATSATDDDENEAGDDEDEGDEDEADEQEGGPDRMLEEAAPRADPMGRHSGVWQAPVLRMPAPAPDHLPARQIGASLENLHQQQHQANQHQPHLHRLSSGQPVPSQQAGAIYLGAAAYASSSSALDQFPASDALRRHFDLAEMGAGHFAQPADYHAPTDYGRLGLG